MKTKSIINCAAFTAITVLLSACGSSSSNSDDISLLAAAFEQGQTTSSAADNNFVATTDEELGDLAIVPVTQTAQLLVHDDFTFETSRSTSVSMSVPEAASVDAEATFCTDYSANGDGSFDVNYDSCVLSAPLFGGQLNEDLNLVNQHTSVIGVVWFQDPTMLPVYKEFHFD